MVYGAPKDLLCSDRTVTHPRTKDPYLLYTDDSEVAVGAILVQEEPSTGIERPISYLSKLLSGAERS